MGDVLRKRIRQERFDSPVEEAVLNLIVTANYIREVSEKIVEKHDLTLGQYNVLRILRGVHPEGHPRCEIAVRLLDRAPDVTRLIDRLLDKDLVERDRSSQDRRKSITRITSKGLKLLERIDPEIRNSRETISRKLSPGDARELSRICEGLYSDSPE